MTPYARLGSAHVDDLHEAAFPLLLPFGGMLAAALPSTSSDLGMRVPQIKANVEALLASAEGVTNAAAVMVDQYWTTTYVSTTDTGIASLLVAPSVPHEVRELRDDISRRTRLTRHQIARALGVDRRSLTSWVSGSSFPASERLDRLRHLAALVPRDRRPQAGAHYRGHPRSPPRRRPSRPHRTRAF